MASYTDEVVEKLNVSDVLSSMEKKRKAEAALATQAKALGVAETDLKKAILLRTRADEESLRAAEQAGKEWASAQKVKIAAEKALNAEVDKELKQAERAIKAEERAAAGARKAAEAQQRWLIQVQRNSAALEDAADTTNKMGAATGNLRSQLFDVAVGLQGGQNPFTIISQQGPQIAEVFLNNTELASKFAAVLPVVGTAAAGAAAVGAPLLGWYYELGVENERLTTLLGKTTAALDGLSDGVQKVVDAEAALETREGLLAGTVSEEQANTIKAQAEAVDVYGGAIGALKEKMGALRTEAESLEQPLTGIRRFTGLLFGDGSTERWSKAKELRKEIASLGEEVEEFEGKQETYAKRTVDVAEGEKKAKDAAKGRTKAIKDEKDALKDLLSAQQDYIKSLQDIDDVYKPKEKDDRTIHEKFDAELRGTLKTINEKEKLAREAARKATQSEEELQEALTEIAIHAEKERAEAIAKIRAEEDAARKAAIDAMANTWADAVIKQAQVEAAAAEQSKQVSAARRDALLSVTDSLASSAAEAFGAESKVAKAAAAVQLIIAEAEMLAKAATLGPIAGPIYAAAGTATIGLAAAKLATADTEIEAFNDTPSMQRRQMGPQGGMMRFAPGDIVDVAAARRPSDLAKQTGSTQPTNVSTTVKFTVNGRTAQSITTHAKRTRRGTDPGAPVAGHRKTRY